MSSANHSIQSVETPGINSFRCRVCRGVHALRKCRRFLGLPAEKRLRAVLINKYCANCLAHQHSGQSCRSKAKCKTCGQSHHTLLHLPGARRRQRRRPAAAPISGPTSSAFAGTPTPQKGSRKGRRHQAASRATKEATPPLSTLMQHKAVSILPTAIVVVQTGQKDFDVRVLIDPCSPTTRINASLARAMGLSATSVGPGEVCTATICSKTSDFHIDAILQIVGIMLRIMNLILWCGDLPVRFRIARTIFIPKTVRVTRPQDFRPISVPLVVVRQLNAILASRLADSVN
ncbi:uncharacterized protein LOC116804652 [Drosophila mojavensis]|uniref:uncharacterized protein LOC116804652 n=1 Tax=Drosophila mojavensis TaxID=7230 RepID=UPI001CD05442|nr:uncharacterized protein LOC116804652 [Drosophila mojavensis]